MARVFECERDGVVIRGADNDEPRADVLAIAKEV